PGGTGTGTVPSSPTGIDCPGTCSSRCPIGTVVTLTATPSSDSAFTGWSGAWCTGTGPCTVTVSAATTVTASFTPTFTLTIIPSGTGAGTVASNPTGITCPATCAAPYPSGTVVTLTATPAAGSAFTGWSGAGCTGTGPCTVTLSAATTVTASFTPTFVLTITPDGVGAGTVTSSPTGITCPATCSAPYPSGTVVALTATP